ncbi:sugar kinase [Blastococcus haudaquaticus]|uniref:2-dehydro-3-deoxygluconokinase n=1 Tax=Blastococcus haudaquaticus TaxID=1938745 RepID=A0A286GRW0_9ACTN|nr:sugar kinase [Blastococcus haudaquaticus]SOD97674.1 2-dehydro-3-deoxygluconokinase [Blastococcus haudaquaticus]
MSEPTADAAQVRVVTAGETMVLVVPTAPGRLRHAGAVTLSIGGAESNVAIGLSRLGVPAAWVSAVGEDEPGELVLHRIRAEGVDTRAVRRVPDRPTGLYLREEVAGAHRVYYYRRGSAASTLAPGAFDPAVLGGADFLHLTGITGALSPEAAEFLPWAARTARAAGVRVSYDVNYRSRLWDAAAARAASEAMLPHVDVLLVGDEEARALWGWDEDTCLDHLADRGPGEVVLKLGARGCAAVVDGERLSSPGFPARQVDPIGAGDAFAAGYLAARLWDMDPAERLRTANAMGAYCVQSLGDYEGLPSRRELTSFLDRTVDLGR